MNVKQNDLWTSIWKLIRLQIIIFLSGFKRGTKRQKISKIIITLLIIGFMVFLVYASWSLLYFLRSPDLSLDGIDMSILLKSIPVLVVYAAFMGILVTSFGVLLQGLYLSGDMDFLLSSPLPIRAVFISKLLLAILPNFALISLFGIPVLFGLGASGNYHFLYYISVVLVLLAMAFTSAAISSLLVMLAVHLFPARRVGEVLAFLGAMSTFLCSQSGQFSNMGELSADQTTRIFFILARLDTLWSPLAWAGRGLVDIGNRFWLSGFGYLSLIFILSVIIFGLVLSVSERLYFSGWASMQLHSGEKKKESKKHTLYSSNSIGVRMIEHIIPADIRAIIVKDFLVLRRDIRNMSQLIFPLILGVTYAIMLLRNNAELDELKESLSGFTEQAIASLSEYFGVLIALFVGWMLLARLAGMAFAHEGRNYWILKTAPLKISRIISAKFLVAYFPSLVLCWSFLVVIWLLRQAHLDILIYSLLVIGLTLAGITSINLAFGIAGTNMDWTNPRNMQRGSAGCLASIATVLFVGFSLAVFFLPLLFLPNLGVPLIISMFIGSWIQVISATKKAKKRVS
jgi:ABC-2 type transport system permease protein